MEQWEMGRRLQAARERKGLSKRQAASNAGISETYWRWIESGWINRPTGIEPVDAPASTLSRAALAVDLDPRQLLPELGFDADDALREVLVARIRTLRPDQLALAEAYLMGLASR